MTQGAFMPSKPVCGNRVGEDGRCGLKPGHLAGATALIPRCCQDERYCCPRQHDGGYIQGCMLCSAEDIAALRADVDALRSQILSRKPVRVRAVMWAADLAHGIIGHALGRLMLAERWISRRRGS